MTVNCGSMRREQTVAASGAQGCQKARGQRRSAALVSDRPRVRARPQTHSASGHRQRGSRPPGLATRSRRPCPGLTAYAVREPRRSCPDRAAPCNLFNYNRLPGVRQATWPGRPGAGSGLNREKSVGIDTKYHQAQSASKPASLWVPSQNGFLLDSPHRHSDTEVMCA